MLKWSYRSNRWTKSERMRGCSVLRSARRSSDEGWVDKPAEEKTGLRWLENEDGSIATPYWCARARALDSGVHAFVTVAHHPETH